VREAQAEDDRRTRPLAFDGLLPLDARQTPTSVLALQRTVGNTAARLVIQRSLDAGYKRPADLRVGAMLLGPDLREDMGWIERQAQEVEAKRPVLDGEMESLHIAADVNGPAAAKEVGALRPAVAGLGGARKEAVKQAIDHYVSVQPQLRATMLRVDAQRKIIVEKIEDLRAAVAHKKGQETKREEGKAQKELDELNEKKNKTNEMIGTFIDFAKILANPEEGVSKALSKATGMVGSMIQDFALGNTYGEQIAAAEYRLSQLKQQIDDLQDEEAVAKVAAAMAGIDAARLEFSALLENLGGTTNEAEIAQEDLKKLLGGLGKAGKAADEAIDEGGAIVQTGNEAAELSHDLADRLDGMNDRIRRVDEGIDRYEEMIQVKALPADEYMDDHESIVTDRRAGSGWAEYVKRERDHLSEVDAFLAKGAYRQPYQKGIEAELTNVRRGL
jgi:hypothetical protein